MSRCYIGRCKCGQVVAAVVDDPLLGAKRVAKDVAEFIREGLTIEQMDTEQVRVTLHRCTCPDRPAREKQGELL